MKLIYPSPYIQGHPHGARIPPLDPGEQSCQAATLKVRDVDHFLETLRNVTVLLPEYAAHAAYGAVAYLKANESADAYAERQGLFVIRATGSRASITNREDFRPRTFGRRQPVARGPR